MLIASEIRKTQMTSVNYLLLYHSLSSLLFPLEGELLRIGARHLQFLFSQCLTYPGFLINALGSELTPS